MRINDHIIEQIIEDYEIMTIYDELPDLVVQKQLCREWSMSPMEMNDIITKHKKRVDDIDSTGDLGDII